MVSVLQPTLSVQVHGASCHFVVKLLEGNRLLLLAAVIQLDKGDFILLCNRAPDENVGYSVELAHSHGAFFVERFKAEHVGCVLDITQGSALSLQPLGRTFYYLY